LTITVNHSWGLPLLEGDVLFWPPSGPPVAARILGGVLVNTEGQVGVTLPSSSDPGGPATYLVTFPAVQLGWRAVAIRSFKFAAAGPPVVLGNVFPGINPICTPTTIPIDC